jgi:hypothetical protein
MEQNPWFHMIQILLLKSCYSNPVTQILLLKSCVIPMNAQTLNAQTLNAQTPNLSWYDVDPFIKQLLLAAADSWNDPARSQDYMNQAIANPDISLDVLVAAYRYFFYRHNDLLALQVAQRVMAQIQTNESLPPTWEQLKPILADRRDDPTLRLYVNAYAASGLIWARLGELDRAKEIAEQVREIDDRRESCAATVFDILTQPPEED